VIRSGRPKQGLECYRVGSVHAFLSARPIDGRSRGLHALQQDESQWASVAVNSCLYEIARIGPTAQLSDQRARGSGRLGRHMATVDQQIAAVKLRFLCHPKKSPAIASHGAKRLRVLPKSCHLLPPAAILCRKSATSVSTVSIHFLPIKGAPASLCPGLRTASGAKRRLGDKLPPSASLYHG
jgi:hypothetical protein